MRRSKLTVIVVKVLPGCIREFVTQCGAHEYVSPDAQITPGDTIGVHYHLAGEKRAGINGDDGGSVFSQRLRQVESRLEQAWASRGGLQSGGVLVFTALSKRPEAFHANLTFVQGHLSFQPEIGNARQLGILQGRLGDLAADELVLGYVVLPDAMDPSRPMDIYWNDRRIEVQF